MRQPDNAVFNVRDAFGWTTLPEQLVGILTIRTDVVLPSTEQIKTERNLPYKKLGQHLVRHL